MAASRGTERRSTGERRARRLGARVKSGMKKKEVARALERKQEEATRRSRARSRR